MRPMRRLFQTVQWKLVIIYISLILIAMQIIGLYFIRTVEGSFVDNFTDSLNYQAQSLAFNVEPYLSDGHEAEGEKWKDLNKLVNNILTLNNGGAQVIDRNGIVVGASESEKQLRGQKNVQVEVNRALLGTRASDIRTDRMSGHRIMVATAPVQNDEGQTVGAVYLWASMKGMYDTVRRINNILATGTIVALVLTAALGVLLSRTITTPVKAITEQATAMASGDFNQRVKIMSNDEIGQLGEAFNHLTVRLDEALSQNEEERGKLASVLANMSDGVIATDWQGRIVVYNERAQHILQRKIRQGDDLVDVLPPFSPKPSWPLLEEREVYAEVGSGEEAVTHLKMSFTTYQRQDSPGGAIVVVQDVTEQERLEQQRKDFVANVSHELRTPLTTINSYLEALDDGALHDPELGPRFLHVTQAETERMIRLVTDLLHLSRLDSKETYFHKQEVPLLPLLEEATNRFLIPCEQKRIALQLNVASPLPTVRVDRDRIVQVVNNLLSNALKYTQEDGKIEVSAAVESESFVKVSIRDNGIGIPKQDLSRIFERFYRVDKARSRAMGGTGLGLSISREIVRAHGGQIDIDSCVEQGTTVSFTLPAVRKGEFT